jgi:hypothetical protein
MAPVTLLQQILGADTKQDPKKVDPKVLIQILQKEYKKNQKDALTVSDFPNAPEWAVQDIRKTIVEKASPSLLEKFDQAQEAFEEQRFRKILASSVRVWVQNPKEGKEGYEVFRSVAPPATVWRSLYTFSFEDHGIDSQEALGAMSKANRKEVLDALGFKAQYQEKDSEHKHAGLWAEYAVKPLPLLQGVHLGNLEKDLTNALDVVNVEAPEGLYEILETFFEGVLKAEEAHYDNDDNLIDRYGDYVGEELNTKDLSRYVKEKSPHWDDSVTQTVERLMALEVEDDVILELLKDSAEDEVHRGHHYRDNSIASQPLPDEEEIYSSTFEHEWERYEDAANTPFPKSLNKNLALLSPEQIKQLNRNAIYIKPNEQGFPEVRYGHVYVGSDVTIELIVDPSKFVSAARRVFQEEARKRKGRGKPKVKKTASTEEGESDIGTWLDDQDALLSLPLNEQYLDEAVRTTFQKLLDSGMPQEEAKALLYAHGDPRQVQGTAPLPNSVHTAPNEEGGTHQYVIDPESFVSAARELLQQKKRQALHATLQPYPALARTLAAANKIVPAADIQAAVQAACMEIVQAGYEKPEFRVQSTPEGLSILPDNADSKYGIAWDGNIEDFDREDLSSLVSAGDPVSLLFMDKEGEIRGEILLDTSAMKTRVEIY